ncbi:MAG: trypsin-like peptidase domain-containing protein [Candidatus Scalindua sp.]|nr:trypsin-like peptidase domain-containing protein [Candidatus Scalindua sp.]
MSSKVNRGLSTQFISLMTFLIIFTISTSYAQDDALIEKIKHNTIQLTATFSDGEIQYGFGFLVGERSGYLYIATAQHVVMKYDDENDQYVKANQIKARFYSDQGKSYSVKILDLKQEDLDLSLLEMLTPDNVAFINGYFAPSVERGDKVWFIGRETKWYVPVIEGKVSQSPNTTGELKMEITAIKPGTSGAPLITKNGIVGLIITDNQNSATAIHIQSIREFVQKYNYPMFWNETNASLPKDTVTIKEYRWKDGLAKIVAISEGTGVNNDILIARILAEKYSMKNIEKKLINKLSEPPYNFDMKDAMDIFEAGEIIEIEYQDHGNKSSALLKYQIKIPKF